MQSNTKERVSSEMSNLSIFCKIRIPSLVWLIDCIGLVFFGGAALFWIYLYRSQLGVGVIVVCSIMLAFFICIIRSLVNHITVSKLTVQGSGLQKQVKKEVAVFKWEDVIRCEPSERYIILFYKNGKIIKIPSDVKDFKSIKNYCLQRIAPKVLLPGRGYKKG